MKRLLTIIALTLLTASLAMLSLCGCSKDKDNSSSSSSGQGDGGGSSAPTHENFYEGYDDVLSGNPSDIYYIDTVTNTLSTSYDSQEKTVSYGTHYKLTTPLVIDGAGNILKVTASVRTKSDQAVESVSGGFFAVAKSGYNVTFTIYKTNGDSPVVLTQSVKVKGADNIYSDGSLVVDYNAAFSIFPVKMTNISSDTVDLTTLMSAETLDAYETAKLTQTVKWKVISILGKSQILDDSIFNVKENGAGAYALAAYIEGVDADTTLFIEVVDFFDENAVPEWNVIGDTVDEVTVSASDNTVVSVADNVVDGDNVKAYKVESGVKGKTADSYSFKLLPRHSAKYYQLYALEGYSLAFDVYGYGGTALDKETYAPLTDPIKLLGYEVYDGKLGKNTRGQQEANKFVTYTLPLSKYGTAWDSFIKIENIAYTQHAWTYAQSTTVYFTNFRLVKDGETDFPEYFGEEVSVKSSRGKVDAFTLVNGDAKEFIFDYSGIVEYSVEYRGKVVDLDGGVFDADAFADGTYVLVAKIKGNVVYRTNVRVVRDNDDTFVGDIEWDKTVGK